MAPVDVSFSQRRIQARKEASESGSGTEAASDAGASDDTSSVGQDDKTSNESSDNDSGSLEEVRSHPFLKI